MESRRLGKSGLEVSVVGLGCNNFGGMIETVDFAASQAVIHAALDAGVTLFDTADCYGTDGGSEVTLGKVLGPRRKDIILATKFAVSLGTEMPRRFYGSRRYVMKAVEDSLRRLNTDYIDLYQYHFPDPVTPLEETLRALEDLVRTGKVRYIGLSNHAGWQVVDATWIMRQAGWSPVLSAQSEYSLLERSVEKELIPALRATGMSLLPYFPLANGLLTGKYRKGSPLPPGRMNLPYFKDMLSDQRLELVGRLDAYAVSQGHTLLELAFSWLLDEAVVASVIAGATSPAQIAANTRSAGWHLTDAQRSEVRSLLEAK